MTMDDMIEMAHGGRELVETIVALLVVVGGSVFTVIVFLTNPARRDPGASAPGQGVSAPSAPPDAEAVRSVRRSVGRIAATLSGGAAVIHLVAAPPHYAEIGDLAAGFVAAAALQGWWALRARGGLTLRLIDVGIAVNVAIVAAWAWTRSVGLPVGELAGGPEPIAFPDAVCTAFEVLLVGVLLVARSGLDAALVGRSWSRPAASIAVVPVLGLVLVLTTLSTVAIATGLDHGATGQATSGHAAGH
jgi:hypothetical protein